MEVMFCNTKPCVAKPPMYREAICRMAKNPTYNTDYSINGVVTLKQVSGQPLKVYVDITSQSKLTADSKLRKHGFHIHQTGDIRDTCDASGSHFNPEGMHHGDISSSIRHVGDFGNLMIPNNGKLVTSFEDKKATLFGEESFLGRSMIIHALEDDLGLKGDSGSLMDGNSGAMAACCVVTLVKEGVADDMMKP
ncbi:uncharacterized protein LOC131929765 [Physella acuta]|uniref:uncharacterized protein LOC131929765 n=1 Tax=Physella acuta TaxID=109671 RepID=UPI0027DDAE4C|nr:uncharacterized protein LOC131929765 [Physella acuta]